MKHTHSPSKKLTAAEVAAVFKDEASLASYLSSLTVEQIQELRDAAENGVIQMDEPVKKTFLKLLDIVKEDTREYEKEFTAKIAPLAHGIAVAMTLAEQLEELEKIQASL
jgi:hypothetical protein